MFKFLTDLFKDPDPEPTKYMIMEFDKGFLVGRLGNKIYGDEVLEEWVNQHTPYETSEDAVRLVERLGGVVHEDILSRPKKNGDGILNEIEKIEKIDNLESIALARIEIGEIVEKHNKKIDDEIKERDESLEKLLHEMKEAENIPVDYNSFFTIEGGFLSIKREKVICEIPLNHIQKMEIRDFGVGPHIHINYMFLMHRFDNNITVLSIEGIQEVLKKYGIGMFSKTVENIANGLTIKERKGGLLNGHSIISIEMASGSTEDIYCWPTQLDRLHENLVNSWKNELA